MEFYEKLQELRKNRGLTQEELAEALFVSRTAISKWESGKGYPSIDSLKAISGYFSVSIDDLLSVEKLLFIAEKENKSSIRGICDLLFGIVDICFLLLIVLPLYPKTMNEYIYSVNLFDYTEITLINRVVYWFMFVSIIIFGIIKVLLVKFKTEIKYKFLTYISMGINIFMVLFLAITREPYAITVAFLLLVIKGIILFKSVKEESVVI
ncbi:MAG: helix-turn-helix transcriptional regulator [Lachnospiraceae bacterium]|nr:helix-turn-helix transcriptional regulator [Lachnospiraceae bacterium]